ncbi:hypothetical protein ACS7SF_08640 [Ralstonia sp. 25C]|uniref:hypothetical protein n=1 Tax=Ralstonia sp. 25C TaxID=3447363 RepID=UPI003F74CF06
MRLALGLVLALPIMANAMTMRDTEFVCPIGKERFHAQQAMSGTILGRELDLRPYGAIAAPTPLPKCPSNGFVMFSHHLSDANLAKLTLYVNSPEYVALKDKHTNYYLAAQLQRKLDRPADEVAYTLLQATWEAQGEAQYKQYAAETLAALEALLAQPDINLDNVLTFQLVAGELERRLGKFDAAKARFLRLRDQGDGAGSLAKSWVDYELTLVEAKDTLPHPMPDPKR